MMSCEQLANTPAITSNNFCFIGPIHCATTNLMSDQYSEEQLRAVIAAADQWYEAFAKSPQFARLSDSCQREAGAIIEFFAHYSYEYLGLCPDKWDRGAVVEEGKVVLGVQAVNGGEIMRIRLKQGESGWKLDHDAFMGK